MSKCPLNEEPPLDCADEAHKYEVSRSAEGTLTIRVRVQRYGGPPEYDLEWVVVGTYTDPSPETIQEILEHAWQSGTFYDSGQ